MARCNQPFTFLNSFSLKTIGGQAEARCCVTVLNVFFELCQVKEGLHEQEDRLGVPWLAELTLCAGTVIDNLRNGRNC